MPASTAGAGRSTSSRPARRSRRTLSCCRRPGRLRDGEALALLVGAAGGYEVHEARLSGALLFEPSSRISRRWGPSRRDPRARPLWVGDAATLRRVRERRPDAEAHFGRWGMALLSRLPVRASRDDRARTAVQGRPGTAGCPSRRGRCRRLRPHRRRNPPRPLPARFSDHARAPPASPAGADSSGPARRAT